MGKKIVFVLLTAGAIGFLTLPLWAHLVRDGNVVGSVLSGERSHPLEDEYWRIKEGMTYREVVGIMGKDGVLVFEGHRERHDSDTSRFQRGLAGKATVRDIHTDRIYVWGGEDLPVRKREDVLAERPFPKSLNVVNVGFCDGKVVGKTASGPAFFLEAPEVYCAVSVAWPRCPGQMHTQRAFELRPHQFDESIWLENARRIFSGPAPGIYLP